MSRSFQRALSAAMLIVALTLAACGSSATTSSTPQTPLLSKDANGTAITIPAKAPQTIVSLGATDSEILGALVDPSRVAAVDSYTDYPPALASKTKITDASGKANIEAIIALKPDLVLSYGGETSDSDKQLMQVGIQVVDLPAVNLTQSLVEIRLVGQLVHESQKADALVNSMQQTIDSIKQKVANAAKVSVYMEVDYSTPGKPYVDGSGSFGDELITIAGGTNIFGTNTSGGGYPQVDDEAVISQNPQVIVLTEDPNYGGDPNLVYQRTAWAGVAAVQQKKVYSILPDLIQRPGPRIVQALQELAKDLHPDLFA